MVDFPTPPFAEAIAITLSTPFILDFFGKNRKKNDWVDQLIDLKNPAPVERHDPEDIIESYSSDNVSDSSDIYTGREHYLTVGKSKIRNDDIILEDEKYFGKKTSLKDLYQDNYDVMENKIDEYNGSFEDSEISSPMDTDNGDSYSDVDSNDFSYGIDEDTEKKRREELKSFIDDQQKDFVQKITKTNQMEIEKGKHVQAQIKIYDCLLDSRIRLQKALIAANNLTIDHEINKLYANKSFAKDAEDEAISLINFLTDIRKTLIKMEKINNDDSILEKEKDVFHDSTTFLHNNVLSLDKQILAWQDETLLKWSDKVKSVSFLSLNKFNSFHQNVLDLIQENLRDKEKLLKKIYIDRTEDKKPENKERFDDTDFYQTLLLDLIDKRMVDSGNIQGIRWSILKQKKQKKNVDTKASKGRRLRYHVHDKLQNFMMPNPVNLWTEEQTEYLCVFYISITKVRSKLFSNLFGQISSNDIKVSEQNNIIDTSVSDFKFFS
ncbi:hypothetical protein PORY_001412 [Pneumocystis oryctolagi]|uniref:Uncharacterized protein n=1 Tax=Pneumocystis oryctolagi TaxID=42067 RepID=A0ACB7CDU1_9ASCO|nr:hypothetical protein PORY_001412 [Pneumocystis oryctolagi]